MTGNININDPNTNPEMVAKVSFLYFWNIHLIILDKLIIPNTINYDLIVAADGSNSMTKKKLKIKELSY